MFEALKKLFLDLNAPEEGRRDFALDDYRVAAVALLVHVGHADGRDAPAERTRLEQIIAARFGLDRSTTAKLIAAAEESDREAVDFYHFTSVLKRALDSAGRHVIISMLWDMALADGEISEFEENVIWRIAELLDVPNRDRVLLRQQAAADAARPIAQGPWSRLPAEEP